MDWVITHSERTGYCEEKIKKPIGKFYDQKVIVIVKVAVTLCNNIYMGQLGPLKLCFRGNFCSRVKKLLIED